MNTKKLIDGTGRCAIEEKSCEAPKERLVLSEKGRWVMEKRHAAASKRYKENTKSVSGFDVWSEYLACRGLHPVDIGRIKRLAFTKPGTADAQLWQAIQKEHGAFRDFVATRRIDIRELRRDGVRRKRVHQTFLKEHHAFPLIEQPGPDQPLTPMTPAEEEVPPPRLNHIRASAQEQKSPPAASAPPPNPTPPAPVPAQKTPTPVKRPTPVKQTPTPTQERTAGGDSLRNVSAPRDTTVPGLYSRGINSLRSNTEFRPGDSTGTDSPPIPLSMKRQTTPAQPTPDAPAPARTVKTKKKKNKAPAPEPAVREPEPELGRGQRVRKKPNRFAAYVSGQQKIESEDW